MRTETVGVTETLIESAKKEFLEHGFQNANLRRISSESGVSTGSIYTRYLPNRLVLYLRGGLS